MDGTMLATAGAAGTLSAAKMGLKSRSRQRTRLGPKPETFKQGAPSILPLGPVTFLKAALNTKQSPAAALRHMCSPGIRFTAMKPTTGIRISGEFYVVPATVLPE